MSQFKIINLKTKTIISSKLFYLTEDFDFLQCIDMCSIKMIYFPEQIKKVTKYLQGLKSPNELGSFLTAFSNAVKYAVAFWGLFVSTRMAKEKSFTSVSSWQT